MRRCLDCRRLIETGSRCMVCRAIYRVPTEWSYEVKARDGFRCVVCGATENIEAHHIIPRSRGGGHTLANGRTLCKRHHSEAHVA